MSSKSIRRNRKIVGIDFFCGCGGVSHGFLKAGINVIAGLDNDISVKEVFEKNHKSSKFFHIDVTKTDQVVSILKKILKEYKDDVIVFSACAPCQPFSLHNRNYKTDVRKFLLYDFIQIIKKLPPRFRPSFIFCENVRTMRVRGEDVLNKCLNSLNDIKYECLEPQVLNTADFGVPQNRKRLIFVAVLKNILRDSIIFDWKYFINKYQEPKKSVRDAIGDLPPIKAGVKENEILPLHISRALSPLNLKRLKSIKSDGGSRAMWDKNDNLNCYKNHKGHDDVYGRMSWDKPAPTLTCHCISISNGRFGHPKQHRAISLLEAAKLQTMGDFKFPKPIFLDKVCRQIGNAVPPKLAEKFGKFILELL